MIKNRDEGNEAPPIDDAPSNVVSALFREAKQAGLAFDRAIDLGHDPHEIHVLMARFPPSPPPLSESVGDDRRAGGMSVGALLHTGISRKRATIYLAGIERGAIVLAVRPPNEAEASLLLEIWEELGAEETYLES